MKKIYIFKILILFSIIIMISLNFSLAMSVGDLTGNTNKGVVNDLYTNGNKLITVFTTIGVVVSVIAIISIGMKYMLSSAEEKAEYKKTLMPYVIGALFIFAASAIAGVIYNVSINLG